jgi:hypothetical protein
MMQISDLRATVNQGLLDFAWRQWSQIGVSASVTGNDQWAVDPEALILFTLGIARWDPRLFDEVLDWIALNQKTLSLQRLRNLTARFPVDVGLIGAAVAWARESVPTGVVASQERASQAHPKAIEQVKRPVFGADVLGFVARADPVFAEHGFIRPVVVRSGKSREPDPRRPVNFAFRLRHLFGPGSRSEVMRVLLTYRDGPLDAARIADEAAFAKRNASEALAAIAASGAISAKWSGNERHFRARQELWATLLGIDELPVFVSWVHLLPATLEISIWLDEKAATTESDYLLGSRARTLIDKVGRDLEIAGVDIPQPPSGGSAYLPSLAAMSNAILAALGAAPTLSASQAPAQDLDTPRGTGLSAGRQSEQE